MQPSDKEELCQIVMEACHHVLPQCGLPISDGADPAPSAEPPTDQLASLIGFSADDLRGTLTIVAPLDLMRESYPLPLSTDDSANRAVRLVWRNCQSAHGANQVHPRSVRGRCASELAQSHVGRFRGTALTTDDMRSPVLGGGRTRRRAGRCDRVERPCPPSGSNGK